MAVLATWPLALHPSRPHLDIFTPAHLLVQHHLRAWLFGRDADLAVLSGLEFPGGVHVLLVGWPTVLLGALLEGLIGPVAALNVSQVGLLALGGLVFDRALRRAGAPAPLLGALVWTAQPLWLHFASAGQFENAAALPLAVCVWGLCAGGWVGAAGLAGGVLLTAFSSPYLVIVAGLLVGPWLLFARPPRGWLLAIAAVAALVPAWRYYGDTDARGRPEMGPGPSLERVGIEAPALLWSPRVTGARLGVAQSMAATLQGQAGALLDAGTRRPDPTGAAEVHAPYLGLAGGLFALVGLARGRRSPAVWAGVALAASAGVLALGDGPVQGGPLAGLPLPWGFTRSLPQLSRMGMAYRFVTGLALAQALLAGWAAGPGQRSGVKAGLAALLVLVDGGAFGVFKLPMVTHELRLAGGYAALHDTGAVLPLPAAPNRDAPVQPQLAPTFPPAMAVLHGRPIAYALSGEGPFSVQQLALVQAARGRGTLDAAALDASLAAARGLGISYLAVEPGQLPGGTWEPMQALLREALGPPDAEGDGVVGWRLDDAR